jgi:cyclase
MNRARIALSIVAAGGFSAAVLSQTPAPEAAYRFQQIQPGIYSAVGTGTMNVGSNSAIIINDDDVLVVDSHISPESARAMLREMKSITDKPVRFLVNTHFHFDHANGNQIFTSATDIIGHEYTRRKLLGPIMTEGLFASLLTGLPGQIEDLRKRAAAEQDAAAKGRLEQQLRVQQAYAGALKELKPTPPTVTMNDRMTIVRGGREMQLLHLGRAHTAGDVVVYLPKERLLCTGDIVYNGIPNLSDGYVNEWSATLERIKALDFVDVIPGHGEPFKGKERLDALQLFMRDLWEKTKTLHDQKVPAAEAAKRLDMTAHKGRYPAIVAPGIPLIGVTRMYEVMEGKAQ